MTSEKFIYDLILEEESLNTSDQYFCVWVSKKKKSQKNISILIYCPHYYGKLLYLINHKIKKEYANKNWGKYA